MPEILLGCGSRKEKQLGFSRDWTDLKTVDINPEHTPDFVHDLSVIPLPFEDDYADEIHAYDVMEHIGQQGDWRFFFAQWSDIWRILKPGGVFFGISPHWTSKWAWGDPGHTRIVGEEQLSFLNQPNYAQVGHSPMTDYRFVYRADFDILLSQVTETRHYHYALRAVKPARL